MKSQYYVKEMLNTFGHIWMKTALHWKFWWCQFLVVKLESKIQSYCRYLNVRHLKTCMKTLMKTFFLTNHFYHPSSLSVELHRTYGYSPLTGLPRRVWEQPELRVADSVRAWKPYSPGLQRLWLGGSLWHPDSKGRGAAWLCSDGPLHWDRSAISPHEQQQHPPPGVPSWPLHVWPRLQHHLQQYVSRACCQYRLSAPF